MIEVLKAAGLDDTQLKKFHQEFERRYPTEHGEFLKWLTIPDDKALEIRKASR